MLDNDFLGHGANMFVTICIAGHLDNITANVC